MGEPPDIGRFLSLVLRHRPDSIGLQLDPGGWIRVSDLLAALQSSGTAIDSQQLAVVVAADDKGRYVFSADGLRIRASHGHSIPVDLGLQAVSPPQRLYHGTAQRFVPAILEAGLLKGTRQFVHLSADVTTAVAVGRRHGPPVVLAVDCPGMVETGSVFFRSDSSVWLVDHVPARFLAITASQAPRQS